ncbi:hypothetical protein JCM11251_004043 [Rhodosporidiobolus azoricus]
MVPVVPYDPPLPRPSSRSSRSTRPSQSQPPPPPHHDQSLFTRLVSGFEAAEHIAHEVGYAAGEVEKAAFVGERVVGDLEDAYGQAGVGRWGRKRSGVPVKAERTGIEGSEEKPLPNKKKLSKSTETPGAAYQSPSQPPGIAMAKDRGMRQRKAKSRPVDDSLEEFEHDLDIVQETVDDLSDLVESIAVLRHRLTGAAYPRISKLLRIGRQPHPLPRSREVEREEATKLAAMVGQAKEDLLEQYKRIRWIQERYEPLAAPLRGRPSSDLPAKKAYARVQKHLLALNASFAALLDFVEDRAKDERKDVEGGEAEQRLLVRMKEERPDWRREKRVAEAKNAREAAKTTGLEKVADISSYTAWWLIDNPFTSFDDVLQTIDHAENGITSKKDEKTGTWALGGLMSYNPPLLSAPFTHYIRTTQRVKPSSPGRRREPEAMLEVGKSHSSPHPHPTLHSYHSEEKPPLYSQAELVSSDEDDLSAEEKKLLAHPSSGKKKVVVDGVDLSQLPERVPTDDTSGYQETQEDLIADAKDQSRTEHIHTPLLVLWWAAIASLYLYWGIARSLGFPNPLGNVDLGARLGNSAWNDTSDGLVRTSASSSTMSSSTGGGWSSTGGGWSYVEPTGPSTIPLSVVEASVSAMRAAASSISAGRLSFPDSTMTTVPVQTASVQW